MRHISAARWIIRSGAVHQHARSKALIVGPIMVLLEVHVAQEALEARVGAQRIPYRVYFYRFSPA